MNRGSAKRIRVLFVCHGNICRSPMAEFLMKQRVEDMGIAEKFHIESAATSSEEIGSPVHRGTAKILNAAGIDCSGKRARRVTADDYENFDYIIGMDQYNLRNLLRFFGGDPENKIRLLLDFTSDPGDVADPWYTRDFDATYRDVTRGIDGFLSETESVWR